MTLGKMEEDFSGLIQHAFKLSRSAEGTQAEADYIQSLLGAPPNAKILDVPCGMGRHALALAERGYQLVGIDISTDAIEEARAAAAAKPELNVQFEHRDMRDLPWVETFDAAYCFWESFNYLDQAGQRDFLKALFHTLKHGGKFVVDMHVLETICFRFTARDWRFVGQSMIVLEDAVYDPATSTLYRQWMFMKDNNTEYRKIAHYFQSYREVLQMFTDIGFVDFTSYNFLTRQPFNFVDAARLVVVATKPER